jgi:putative intracellular protease/amidase
MTAASTFRFLILIAEGDSEEGGNPEVNLVRIAAPYYAFKDFGADVVVASSLGGPPMLAKGMRDVDEADEAVRRFKRDRNARDELADTLGLEQIVVDDFDAAFCVGLSGGIWTDSHGVAALVRNLLGCGKPVAVVPGKNLLVAPGGAGNGLLILADNEGSPLCAARALIDVVTAMRRDKADQVLS